MSLTPARTALSASLGINACVICDCGHTTFKVGIRSEMDGNTFIRMLECAGCGKQLPIPFMHKEDGAPGFKRGGPASKETVREMVRQIQERNRAAKAGRR